MGINRSLQKAAWCYVNLVQQQQQPPTWAYDLSRHGLLTGLPVPRMSSFPQNRLPIESAIVAYPHNSRISSSSCSMGHNSCFHFFCILHSTFQHFESSSLHGSFQLTSSMLSFELATEVCCVFFSRVLPSISGEQPRRLARVSIVWGSLTASLINFYGTGN